MSGRWVHAHEEDTEDEMVFRPAGTDLPPSRGRMAFELRADGTFAETGLGATDVPEEATGSWALEGDTITLSEGADARCATRDGGRDGGRGKVGDPQAHRRTLRARLRC